MGEEENRSHSSENGGEGQPKEREEEEEVVLQLLDSTDSYLTLIDSLSSTLRQRWLELASARHSMGSSRVNSALFDLKLHPAATTLQVTQLDNESPSRGKKRPSLWSLPLQRWLAEVEIRWEQNHILLYLNGHLLVMQKVVQGNQFLKSINNLMFRHYVVVMHPKLLKDDKEPLESNGPSVTVDDQVEKVRSKSLSVFGTLVSPKLRTSQHSFEKALETLVEIANMRSLTLSAYAQLQNDMDTTT